MNHFKAEQFVAVAAQLQMLQESANFAISHGHSADAPHPIALAQLPILVTNAKQLCREVGLLDSLQQIELAEGHLNVSGKQGTPCGC